jgi:SAM-dependent methyltransferase
MSETILPYKALHEENRRAWNAATPVHNSHKDDQAAFLRGGGSTLFPEEVALLGDIAGLSLLHLQCNAGQDTLSLAARGATVTGVDISDEAIDFARQISADSGIPATFERADVYDWLAEASAAGRQFDLVFSSYGFNIWLSDIWAWARGVAAVLKPGGRFVAVEFHPFSMMFEFDWSRKYDYFGGGKPHSYDSGVGDYVQMSGAALTPSGWVDGVGDFRNPHPGHEWQWTLADIVGALLGAGLTLTALEEYPYSNGGKLFDRMREGPGQRMYPPEEMPALPLMFGLAARKG